eukprot:6066920-Amphidinium_carterae.1
MASQDVEHKVLWVMVVFPITSLAVTVDLYSVLVASGKFLIASLVCASFVCEVDVLCTQVAFSVKYTDSITKSIAVSGSIRVEQGLLKQNTHRQDKKTLRNTQKSDGQIEVMGAAKSLGPLHLAGVHTCGRGDILWQIMRDCGTRTDFEFHSWACPTMREVIAP